ncbi:DNA mismatch repair protein mutS [Achromobacter xylosoxidans]|uniref:MutS-related protein n=1 Tax=Alcaligenes xylosoxydans xylosoxydans TaxID=85698 RepID=UPI0006BFD778|nr:DNA mismatch repair protein MutS [Achromobacter xylosoxidans]CUJ03157.1 DNA mismatch repair protein mutS [Achromobacter xylosoxidans]CUJ19713.1 DNA mismatch repair protein mutS [Achromobacter xylosoxidans]
MKVHLMYPNRDFDMNAAPPLNGRDLMDDLELQTLVQAMAGDDDFLRTVARTALLGSVRSSKETVEHRQAVLRDALAHSDVVRQLYQLSIDALESKKKSYWGIGLHYPLAILHGSMEVIELLIPMLRQLRDTARKLEPEFSSKGWTRLFAMLSDELDESYIGEVQGHLKTLKFRGGILMSAHLGPGNRSADYVLRTPLKDDRNWLARLFGKKPEMYQYTLPPRDENGARALSELADRGINLVANALAQSAEHISSFFTLLRAELAFYVCCINLHDRLVGMSEPICFPAAVESGERQHRFNDLYDVCLALKMRRKVVSNVLDAGESRLLIVTGANQGGKSSFLRSLGLAQLMMQCGMFVGAASFSANLCEGLYTHYKREEDTTMESGKFDEELKRMRAICDEISPNAMVLFNESFASTNEREGSEVARMIVGALLEGKVKVAFVTHQYSLAHHFYARHESQFLFLRAQRLSDGTRTFKVTPGEPQQTSYGADLYAEIFASDDHPTNTVLATATAERPQGEASGPIAGVS